MIAIQSVIIGTIMIEIFAFIAYQCGHKKEGLMIRNCGAMNIVLYFLLVMIIGLGR